MTPSARHRPTRAQGLLEMVGSALLFGFMAFLTKRATKPPYRIGGAEVAMVRFAIGGAAVLGQAALRRAPLRIVRWDFVLSRAMFGSVAVLLYFLSIDALPVGTATLLNYTAPVFTATFAALFIGEKLPRIIVLALGVTAIGVALVVYGQGQALGGAYGWQALALVSAVASGAAVTSIRAARRTDGAWEIFGMFCLVGIVTTAPFAFRHWTTPSLGAWALIAAVGILALVAQMLMTHALGAVEAAVTGIINQLAVVTSIALGTSIDGEPLTHLSAWGAALTLIGVTWAARVSARSQET